MKKNCLSSPKTETQPPHSRLTSSNRSEYYQKKKEKKKKRKKKEKKKGSLNGCIRMLFKIRSLTLFSDKQNRLNMQNLDFEGKEID